jgi:hypothetical protein
VSFPIDRPPLDVDYWMPEALVITLEPREHPSMQIKPFILLMLLTMSATSRGATDDFDSFMGVGWVWILALALYAVFAAVLTLALCKAAAASDACEEETSKRVGAAAAAAAAATAGAATAAVVAAAAAPSGSERTGLEAAEAE